MITRDVDSIREIAEHITGHPGNFPKPTIALAADLLRLTEPLGGKFAEIEARLAPVANLGWELTCIDSGLPETVDRENRDSRTYVPRYFTYVDGVQVFREAWEVRGLDTLGDHECGAMEKPQAEFVFHARTDISALLQEVHRLTAEREADRQEIERKDAEIASLTEQLSISEAARELQAQPWGLLAKKDAEIAGLRAALEVARADAESWSHHALEFAGDANTRFRKIREVVPSFTMLGDVRVVPLEAFQKLQALAAPFALAAVPPAPATTHAWPPDPNKPYVPGSLADEVL